jgi:hypothetical protein
VGGAWQRVREIVRASDREREARDRRKAPEDKNELCTKESSANQSQYRK